MRRMPLDNQAKRIATLKRKSRASIEPSILYGAKDSSTRQPLLRVPRRRLGSRRVAAILCGDPVFASAGGPRGLGQTGEARPSLPDNVYYQTITYLQPRLALCPCFCVQRRRPVARQTHVCSRSTGSGHQIRCGFARRGMSSASHIGKCWR